LSNLFAAVVDGDGRAGAGVRGERGGTSAASPPQTRDATVHPSDNRLVPLTVFDCKGIPAAGREGIEAAVTAGGKHVAGPHEAWIAADPARGDVRVIITGPLGFERRVAFR